MSYIEELKELAKLKDDGILTEDEFQKKKEEILSNNSESEPVSKKTEATPPEKKGFLDNLFTMIKKGRVDKVAKKMMKDDPKFAKAVKTARQSHKDLEDYVKMRAKKSGLDFDKL
tara:strand:+ start:152 stop:496 length:345 start_codon:yes stop_codon:yes gene_type:complete